MGGSNDNYKDSLATGCQGVSLQLLKGFYASTFRSF